MTVTVGRRAAAAAIMTPSPRPAARPVLRAQAAPPGPPSLDELLPMGHLRQRARPPAWVGCLLGVKTVYGPRQDTGKVLAQQPLSPSSSLVVAAAAAPPCFAHLES